MAHLDAGLGKTFSGFRTASTPPVRPRIGPVSGSFSLDVGRASAVVHVVDDDADVRGFLSRCLAAAGIGSQSHAHLGEFLGAHPTNLPGCLVIDAAPLGIGLSRLHELSASSEMCSPIIVTAWHADVDMVVTALKTGAVDFVEKPLQEQKIVAAVRAAVEIDRQKRLTASRSTEVWVRFAALSERERQVMVEVTAGRRNKQIAGDLGLSEITVKVHRGAVMRKMGARSLADLVRLADALGQKPAQTHRVA